MIYLESMLSYRDNAQMIPFPGRFVKVHTLCFLPEFWVLNLGAGC